MDCEREECVDPGENGAILDAGGGGDLARQAGEERAVGVRQWRR
jgi:hypothetical protein